MPPRVCLRVCISKYNNTCEAKSVRKTASENSPLVAVARRRDPCLATFWRVQCVVDGLINVHKFHAKYSGNGIEY